MTSSSHKKKKSREQPNNSQGILENWFAGDSEAMTRFIHETSIKQINVPKVLEFSWLRDKNLTEAQTLLKHQKLKSFMEMTGNVYPDLVKVLYSNLVQDGKNLVSYVKGEKLKITREIWSNVGGIKYSRLKLNKGNTAGILGFNKMQFYRSCVRNPTEPVVRFHVGNLTLIPRLLPHIIASKLTPRGSNHVLLHEEDLILLYCIMNQLKVNLVSTMVEHMLKSTRLPDYRFPYAIFVFKLIDYFEVDNTNERNDTIKAASEIDNSTLMKMGFHKEEDNWVFKRNVAYKAEHEASNHGDAEEENVGMHTENETVQAAEASFHRMHHSSSHRVESPTHPSMQHMQESPVHSFMNEDVAATNYNALVAYQASEYRGEPLLMFERQVLDRLHTLTNDQKTYFEMTQVRFQHLDYQIEGVQE